MTTFAYYLDLMKIERDVRLNRETDRFALYCIGKVHKADYHIEFYHQGNGLSDCFNPEKE